ncbi:DUF4326 domain-containing protein [Rhodococcus sp. IEGM 1409]|uniref:DUF4326 domain-containing protein n=1 Tax=Rhodococcus sp. IEGM 1409 TaxID=3047082 RepID=UPI0024B85C81|nr:DUF4326 domain-containing protein [Rhodococcus sp. IEGM 1409]MDI9901323.1 DUF4326 domain-containing protein [Rhodococcus sp. IEGM 1409]
MSEPKRIQRKRTKGWKMPENAVYVGRPTKWGNPFRVVKSSCCPTWDVVDDNGSAYVVDHAWAHANQWKDLRLPGALNWARSEAVRLYRLDITELLVSPPLIAMAPKELAGKDLACWCPLDSPCHVDVLLELANGAAS